MGYVYLGMALAAWTVLAFLANCSSLYIFRLGADRVAADAPRHALAFLAVFHGVFGAAGLALGLLGLSTGSARAGVGWGALGGAMLTLGGVPVMLAFSVEKMPGSLVYPITNGGSALAVTVLSVIFLREHPGWTGRLGIAAGVAALVLLGLAAG